MTDFSELESSLSESSTIFDEIIKRREELIKESRDVISLCSKGIILVHTADLKGAEELRKTARTQLLALKRVAGADLTKYLITPEQEYVECAILIAVSLEKPIPSRKSLGVSLNSYVLGLLDLIGELKRKVYDSIRKKDFDTAEKMFSIMQQIYTRVSPFALYDHVVQGIRRKLDVARILIEDTRAIITEESRRREFISALNKVSDKLGLEGITDS
ncbi:MAG: RNA-binding protein [Nitrososphaerales archaeon]